MGKPIYNFFELGDRPTLKDCNTLGVTIHSKFLWKFSKQGYKVEIKGVKAGEFRAPKKGEWYLSGAIPQVWRAPNDLTQEFIICRLVAVTKVVTHEEV